MQKTFFNHLSSLYTQVSPSWNTEVCHEPDWLSLLFASDVKASLTGFTYGWQLDELITIGTLIDPHQNPLEVTEDVTGECTKNSFGREKGMIGLVLCLLKGKLRNRQQGYEPWKCVNKLPSCRLLHLQLMTYLWKRFWRRNVILKIVLLPTEWTDLTFLIL